mgnify:CR=1 FL=1
MKRSCPLVLAVVCLVMSAWGCSGSELSTSEAEDVALDAAVEMVFGDEGECEGSLERAGRVVGCQLPSFRT